MNIASYIQSQEPVASWTTLKKLAMLTRFCRNKGMDIETATTAEMKVFFNKKILDFIKGEFEADSEKEKIAVAREDIETIDFTT